MDDTVICADCGSLMELRRSKYGKFYGCTRYPECRGAHGAHPDGKPLGIPANLETKQARMKAHAAFDRLWKSGRMKRKQAYRWMRDVMGMKPHEAHIGKFSKEQCERLVERVEWDETAGS